MLQQQLYTRRYAIRLPAQLNSPRLNRTELLQLPRDSVFHYMPASSAELGPPIDHPFIRKATKQVFIRHITDMATNKGNPKPNYVQPGPMIQDYRRNHRRLRPLLRWESADRDPLNLIVINYAMLQRMRRYVTSAFAGYYKWYNIYATMLSTAADIAVNSNRQQFVVMNLPEAMPSIQALRRGERNIDRNTLRHLRSNEALQLLDLWNWMGKKRSESVLGSMDSETLEKLNIVFVHYGQWFVVNLGTLDTWRKGVDDTSGIDPQQMQLRFYKMLVTLHESASDVVEVDLDALAEAEEVEEDTEVEEQEEEEEFDEDEQEEVLRQLDEIEQSAPVEEEELEASIVEDDDDAEMDSGDEGEEETDSPTFGKKHDAIEYTEADNVIKARADAMASAGELTGPEYRRLLKVAELTATNPDPYGSKQSLVEAATISPKDLILDKVQTTPDQPEIMDKTMLHSTVEAIDRQYISKVLKKDVLRSVLAVQNAGVAVGNYTVDHVKDAVSDYEVHTVTLVPMVGRQSTVRFKLPVVQPDGTYISNGTRYRLRKQKTD